MVRMGNIKVWHSQINKNQDLLKEHEVNAKLRDFFAKYEAFKNSRMNRANTENTEGITVILT